MKLTDITRRYECCSFTFTESISSGSVDRITPGDDDWEYCAICGAKIPWKEGMSDEEGPKVVELGDPGESAGSEDARDPVPLAEEGSGEVPEESGFYGLDFGKLPDSGEVHQEGGCGSPHCRNEECPREIIPVDPIDGYTGGLKERCVGPVVGKSLWQGGLPDPDPTLEEQVRIMWADFKRRWFEIENKKRSERPG